MELSHQVLPSIAAQYQMRFGDAGAFNRALFPEIATVALMTEALRRGAPVSLEDLDAMHQTLYHQPLAGDTAAHPSGSS